MANSIEMAATDDQIPQIPQIEKDEVICGRKLGCDVRLVSSQVIDGGRRIQIVLEGFNERVRFVIPSPGLHLAVNACAAAAVASALGVPLSLAANSLSRFTPVHRRSELEVAENGITKSTHFGVSVVMQ